MTKNVNAVKVIRDYDGRPLEAGEMLALFPYNPDLDKVTNPDSLTTIYRQGRAFRVCKKAIPADWSREAKKQIYSWQEDSLPSRRDGRCLIPQPDGSLKECPRKKGNNHSTCAKCPKKYDYKRKDKSFVYIEDCYKEIDINLGETPSALDELIAKEDFNEPQQKIINIVKALAKQSPKHAFAMLLEGLGYKGDTFAQKMQMTKVGANYVRKQVNDFATNGISDLGQIDFSRLKANKSKNDEYYRQECKKALKALIEMYF